MKRFLPDVVAGITVGIVALPLALAFGAAAGVGPEAGLVTAIVAGFLAAIFGGSRVQVSGPTGAMVVVLAPIVAEHGVRSVAIVSGLAGIILVAAGWLKLGRVVGYVPWPVIEGFTVGIGVIIASQQIPAMFDTSGTVGANALSEAIRAISEPGPNAAWTAGVVGAVVVIMVVSRRVSTRIPDSLMAVVIVTVAVTVLDAPVARIGALPDSLPAPSLPHVDDVSILVQLLPAAFAVAVLSAIESLLSARVAGNMADVGVLDSDRELRGQGIASIAAGMFGGMPATGAIARTAVSVMAGGRTRLAACVHSLVLVIIVLVASQLVEEIPLSVLAGVLIVVASRMVDRGAVRAIARTGRSTLMIFVITAIITISFDLIVAVMIGIVVAAFFVLRQVSRTSGVQREPLPGPAHDGDENIALLTLRGPVIFTAADQFSDEVLNPGGATVVILRMSQLSMVDSTGARMLADLRQAWERKGISVIFKGVRDVDERVLRRTGAIAEQTLVFDDLESAISTARELSARRPGLPPQFTRL